MVILAEREIGKEVYHNLIANRFDECVACFCKHAVCVCVFDGACYFDRFVGKRGSSTTHIICVNCIQKTSCAQERMDSYFFFFVK